MSDPVNSDYIFRKFEIPFNIKEISIVLFIRKGDIVLNKYELCNVLIWTFQNLVFENMWWAAHILMVQCARSFCECYKLSQEYRITEHVHLFFFQITLCVYLLNIDKKWQKWFVNLDQLSILTQIRDKGLRLFGPRSLLFFEKIPQFALIRTCLSHIPSGPPAPLQNIEHLKVFDPIVLHSCVIRKFIAPYNIFSGKDSR